MKTVIKSLIAVTISCFALCGRAYDFWADGIAYDYNDVVGTVSVANNPEVPYQGDVVIPATVINNGKSYMVTAIGESAFEDCTQLTGVELPSSIVTISSNAFLGCTGLTSVDIPESVTSIGGSAFCRCTGLASINLSNTVTYIGGYAFADCTALTYVSIPASVATIEFCAFENCAALTDIVVDENNPYYDSRNNCNAIIETASNTLVVGCVKSVIPASVTAIGRNAFSVCKTLKSITIPGAVTSIGIGAFSGCSGLTTVVLPASVSFIGSSAFSSCTGLRSINIPASVTAIGESLFSGCSSLTSITIPYGVTLIDNVAFSGCSGLKSVEIPNSVTRIGGNAFNGCTGMTTLSIGNSVTEIGWMAFYGCSSLKSITIPNTVTEVGYNAFDRCSSLTSVTLYGFGAWNKSIMYLFDVDTLNIGSGISSLGKLWISSSAINCYAVVPPGCVAGTFLNYDAELHVPIGSEAAYRNAEYWKNFANIYDDLMTTAIVEGDVNGDNMVDIDDVNALISIMLGFNEADRYVGISHFYDDGVVDIDDVNAVINIMLGL